MESSVDPCIVRALSTLGMLSFDHSTSPSSVPYPTLLTSILRFIVDMMWKTHPPVWAITLTRIEIVDGARVDREKLQHDTGSTGYYTLFIMSPQHFFPYSLHFFPLSFVYCKSVATNNRLFALSFLSFVKAGLHFFHLLRFSHYSFQL